MMNSWFYRYILNSSWFLWTVTVLIIALNFLAPVLVWLIMAGKAEKLKLRKKNKTTASGGGEGG
ncbi:MAG: hypothetical protein K0Q90_2799 [Paenibacillaceae bacterium]|jgi:hypothetical protein|nr:hypothetical protein [Paenibacillaceae bacterium]